MFPGVNVRMLVFLRLLDKYRCQSCSDGRLVSCDWNTKPVKIKIFFLMSCCAMLSDGESCPVQSNIIKSIKWFWAPVSRSVMLEIWVGFQINPYFQLDNCHVCYTHCLLWSRVFPRCVPGEVIWAHTQEQSVTALLTVHSSQQITLMWETFLIVIVILSQGTWACFCHYKFRHNSMGG